MIIFLLRICSFEKINFRSLITVLVCLYLEENESRYLVKLISHFLIITFLAHMSFARNSKNVTYDMTNGDKDITENFY